MAQTLLHQSKRKRVEQETLPEQNDEWPIKRSKIIKLLQELSSGSWESVCWRKGLNLRTENELFHQEKCIRLPIQRPIMDQHLDEASETPQKLLQDYYGSPSVYIVREVYKVTLQDWKAKRLEPDRAFALCIHIIHLADPIKIYNKKLWDTIYHDLTNVLKDKRWSPTAFCKTNSVMNFGNLLTVLRFVSAYLVKSFNNRAYYPAFKLIGISETVVQILRLLVSSPRSEEQKKHLKDTLKTYFATSNVWDDPQFNLILKVSTNFHPVDINSSDLELIQMLLKAGANPNVIDSTNSTPLHILATKESGNSQRWPFCISEAHKRRFETFTKTVEVFLENTTHHEYHDHPNRKGQLALQLLSEMQYPDPGLQRLLNSAPRKVPSLTCLAASIVRKHNIGYDNIPIDLQYFIEQH
ncbi:hypothetical protein DAPPUDRAFT_105893 [Daphnia pulex]|uniref:Uncharacterized protein n=1 Tax=Daphnia pulex TaxID=6669 RepID=E9GS60_DAPPU|nr:hypothetical protein DAPPUDRAFT_105893 [Daphnia pulex]|eukprot:EFX77725.1 hypothetical protein DAPPUDRAFT_105893 [Daphnia pulex]